MRAGRKAALVIVREADLPRCIRIPKSSQKQRIDGTISARHPETRILLFCAIYRTIQDESQKISLLVLLLVIADQALKIWVKTHMYLDESITVFPDWFQLHFIENKGAAFGMRLSLGDTYDWGKLLLGLFRIALVSVIGWFTAHLYRSRPDTPKGVFVGLALILAGALGNILDSAFYGLLFRSPPPTR